jgi:hypothetical protein
VSTTRATKEAPPLASSISCQPAAAFALDFLSPLVESRTERIPRRGSPHPRARSSRSEVMSGPGTIETIVRFPLAKTRSKTTSPISATSVPKPIG